MTKEQQHQGAKRNLEDSAYDAAYRVTIVDLDEDNMLGRSKAKVMLQRGIYMGKEFTYIAKHCASARKARAELRIYSTLLHPLQGFYIPTIIGITDICEDGMNFAMSMPHAVGWNSAHFPLSDEAKDKVVEALHFIHARGVLHGDIASRHILIDDNETVTIIDFSNARTIEDHTDVDLQRCTQEELELEMRKLKYLIGYGDAREIERKAAAALQDTVSREHSAKNPVFGLAGLDARDQLCAVEYTRIEVPPDKRNYCPSTLTKTASRESTDSLDVQFDEAEHQGRRYEDRGAAGSDVPIDADGNPYLRYHSWPLKSYQDLPAPALTAGQYQIPQYRALTSLFAPVSRHSSPVLQDPVTGESMWEALYASVESRLLPSLQPVQQSPVICASSPNHPRSGTLGIIDTRLSTDSVHPDTESVLDSSTPPNPHDKRSFQVAFTSETEDNSLWSTWRTMKRRRPATHSIAAEDTVESLPETLCYLSAITQSTVDAFEAPPHRDTSVSPAPQSPNSATTDIQEDDESEAVYIVITSPIGHRRVWGVSETVAAEVSRLLDRRQDGRIPESARAYEVAHAAPAIKRKLEEDAQQDSEAKLKVARNKSHRCFSRIFG